MYDVEMTCMENPLTNSKEILMEKPDKNKIPRHLLLN